MDDSRLKPIPAAPVATSGDGGPPVSEADLHAFADGLLPEPRRAEIEAFLERHPAERQRVDDWCAQNLALKQWLDPVAAEALPLRLPLSPPPVDRRWRGWAAGVAIALVSGGAAWGLRGVVDQHVSMAAADGARLPGFVRRAAVAHAVYSPDARRPVEVAGDQQQALVTWLTKRMGVPVRAPDLQALGYTLVGGRLLPGEKGPVAQFMFSDPNAQRLTLYITREEAGRETAFRFGQDGALNVFYWVDKDFGYAISSAVSRAEVLRVSQAVYGQLEAIKPSTH